MIRIKMGCPLSITEVMEGSIRWKTHITKEDSEMNQTSVRTSRDVSSRCMYGLMGWSYGENLFRVGSYSENQSLEFHAGTY
jgi:hypothetical protein